MIIAAVPGVRGSDDACTGAWYAELRRRYYHIMPGLEQNESGIGCRAARQFGGNGGGYDGQRRGREVRPLISQRQKAVGGSKSSKSSKSSVETGGAGEAAVRGVAGHVV